MPRSRRITRHAEFARAQRRGVSCRGRHAVVIAFARGDALPARLGIVASRKIGPAVARNLLKRRIREWFRCSEIAAGVDLIVIGLAGAVEAPAAALWRCLEQAAAGAIARLRAAPR